MIKRTLYFENPAILSTKEEQMVISLVKDPSVPDIVKTVTIPIEDIGVMVLDNKQITITHALLNKLVENNAGVITCDDRHMPSSLFMPLAGNTIQCERFADQIKASIPLQKQLWQQTIQAKIINQACLLKKAGFDYKYMIQCARNVKSDDSQNHEARAAAYYWFRIFSNFLTDFKRGREEPDPNNLLNYGYAILRAVVARSLVATGLLPTLGIHHRNRFNAYCLADDIMEPYRPFVDKIVFDIIAENPKNFELNTEMKKKLLIIPLLDVIIDGQKSPLMIAMQRTTSSLYLCFSGDKRKLLFPTFD
jgi:CRISP-associated protein Cas1